MCVRACVCGLQAARVLGSRAASTTTRLYSEVTCCVSAADGLREGVFGMQLMPQKHHLLVQAEPLSVVHAPKRASDPHAHANAASASRCPICANEVLIDYKVGGVVSPLWLLYGSVATQQTLFCVFARLQGFLFSIQL